MTPKWSGDWLVYKCHDCRVRIYHRADHDHGPPGHDTHDVRLADLATDTDVMSALKAVSSDGQTGQHPPH